MAISTVSGAGHVASAATFVPPAACSISIWALATNLSGLDRLIGIDNLWELRTSGTTFLMELYQTGTVPSTTITTGVWYHIVGSYASSTSNLQLWLNGVLVASKASQGAPGVTNRALSIGLRTGAPTSNRWEGLIDDPRIYDRQLSQAEVESIYALRGADAIYDGLLHRWQFLEGAPGASIGGAGTVKDIVGGLDMGAIGSPVFAESELRVGRIAA